MRVNLLLNIIVFCFVFSSCEKEVDDRDIVYLTENRLKEEVRYTNDNSLDLYYFVETKTLKPVVVFVHGGAWVAGDKSEWTVSHANLFLEDSIISVSVNYSLTKHPSQIKDISRAVKWVCDNIEDYGGDKKRIYLLGYSAGAHLVSLLCTDETYLNDCGLSFDDIKAVCAYDGGNYMRQLETVIGSEIENVFRYVFGDEEDKWVEILPYYQIKENTKLPPFIVIAENDNDSRRLSNKEFANKLRNCGHIVEELYVSSCDHIGVFTIKFFEEDIQRALINWINK